MSSNLFELFQNRYSGHLKDTFLALPNGENYSFEEIDDLSARMAGLLVEENVVPGDRVVLQTDKSAATVALYLAVLRVGAIFVPLNTAYTASEIDYFLGDAKPKLFFCQELNLASLEVVASGCGVSRTLVLGTNAEEYFWEKSLNTAPLEDVVPRDSEDLAAFLYTSGTTGRSKGAMLSHKNLISNAQTLHQLWEFKTGDVLLHALPIFHIHGLFVALHCALLNASKVLFLPSFEVSEVLEALRSGTTVMMGVPTFYTRLLASSDFSSEDCAKVRVFISGSAPMTEQVHQEWTDKTEHKILERYGMTEAGMITSNPYLGDRVPGTVGYALPGVEVRIADSTGAKLSPGEIGVIEVKGPNIFLGYWQMPEKTAEEFREDGFFITGDVGVMDDDGRVSIVGREKDLIISGGYNVYPKEIEVLLDEQDLVSESAVIGVPHQDFGESVVAVVVAKPGAELQENELLSAISGHLARFKQPKKVYFVNELPRNTMGKVQKNLLRKEYENTYTK